MIIAVVAFFFPLLALFLESRFSLFKKLGSIVICYAVGIIIGNLGFDFTNSAPLKNLTDISIPIAIPLFIYGTDFLGWLRQSKKTVLAFSLCILSVCLASFGISLLFASQIQEVWKVGGMLVGVYTGGTPNLTAIGQSLSASADTILLTNSMDMVMGSLFLAVLLFFGKSFLSGFLQISPISKNDDNNHHGKDQKPIRSLIPGASIGLVISSLSLALAFILSQVIFQDLNIGFLIFMVSTFGILFSFIPSVRKLNGPFELGQYLLMIFCFGLGTMADFQQLLAEGGPIMLMVFMIVLITVLLHFSFSKILKIDRDTAVITCVAGIFGPPFVPLIAERYQNRSLIVPGITTGLVGLALGNYLGVFMAKLLELVLT